MKHVSTRQTDTGVKDGYTQYWIDQIIARFRKIKQDTPRRPSSDIQNELQTWVEKNKEKIYSGFLSTKGLLCIIS